MIFGRKADALRFPVFGSNKEHFFIGKLYLIPDGLRHLNWRANHSGPLRLEDRIEATTRNVYARCLTLNTMR
jgi:hypothetical protein